MNVVGTVANNVFITECCAYHSIHKNDEYKERYLCVFIIFIGVNLILLVCGEDVVERKPAYRAESAQ